MNLQHAAKFLSIKFWFMVLGTIALSTVLNACGKAPQTSSPSNTTASPGNMGVDHRQAMSHGSMMHGMDLGPADADYDLRFIDAMIPHHEGAVIMAQNLAQKTKRPELKKLAQEIISAQAKEITQMQQWRKAWYPKATETPMAWHAGMKQMKPMDAAQRKAMRMNMDLGTADAEYDLRFLQAMVPHHEAAVAMAQDLAKKTKRPELQKLAKDIIGSQQAEIDQMKQWQKAWYQK